jgi:DegV family protein with EDD domain
MIGIATDSNSQIPPELAARYGVVVVPLAVTVDGREYLEGVDLDADAFYRFFADGTPSVSTAQPSPGAFADAYRSLADRGAEEILSVHIGSSISGTINSARLAAAGAEVPVRIVDTGTASFAITCCLWEAAEALAGGAGLEAAAQVAESVAARVGNVFVVRALDVARAGGRLAEAPNPAVARPSIPVLTLEGGSMRAIGDAGDVASAAEVMAGHVRAAGRHLRVGVGVADAGAMPLGEALAARLTVAPEVREVVRYRCGPSVGAHTGPGTVGAMYYPAHSAATATTAVSGREPR